MKRNMIVTALGIAVGYGFLRRSGRMGSEGRTGSLPGRTKELKSRMLETGAALLQHKAPLDAMNMYLEGFHFFADDMGRQMQARHYCTQLTEEFIQCVIFDHTDRDARLIGVEYIVSEELFRRFPSEEKRLWHSHHYEVKSGALVAPGVPLAAEHELMKKIVTTYGKTWHTWDTHQNQLPFGIPALMMGFTADGQMDERMLAHRDRTYGISSARHKENRRDIPLPTVDPLANSWESGRTMQLELGERSLRSQEEVLEA
jgi:hypothetical protein